MKEKLQRDPFPASFQWKFLASKILVVSVDKDTLVAACGVRSAFNICTLYVREGYRRRGIGKQTMKKTISEARKRNLSFFFGTVVFGNVPVLRLDFSVGFRELVRLKEFKLIFLMLPLGTRGELAYTFLHSVCSVLPNTLLAYIASLSEKMAIASSGELAGISQIPHE